MIKIIDNIIDFKDKEKDWEYLYNQDTNNTPFQSFMFNYISWEYIQNNDVKLYIILYYNTRNILDAIFPLYINKKKEVRFINDIHCDYCDGIYSNDSYKYDIIEELYKEIKNNNNIKFIYFDNLRGESPISQSLKAIQRNAFIFSTTETSGIYCKKNDSPNLLFPHLNSRRTSRLNCSYKKCNNIRLKIFRKGNNLYPDKEVKLLNEIMINKGLRSKEYLNPEFMQYIKNLYNNGLVEIPIIYEGDNAQALCFIYKWKNINHYMTWIILYSDTKYNMPLHFLYLKEMMNKEDFYLDFGRGGYDYKIQHFRPEIKNVYRLLYSKTLLGNLYIFFKINISHLRKTINTLRK